MHAPHSIRCTVLKPRNPETKSALLLGENTPGVQTTYPWQHISFADTLLTSPSFHKPQKPHRLPKANRFSHSSSLAKAVPSEWQPDPPSSFMFLHAHPHVCVQPRLYNDLHQSRSKPSGELDVHPQQTADILSQRHRQHHVHDPTQEWHSARRRTRPLLPILVGQGLDCLREHPRRKQTLCTKMQHHK